MPRSENVALTLEEVRGLRMALRFGVPDPEPAEIVSALSKLGEAQLRLERPLPPPRDPVTPSAY